LELLEDTTFLGCVATLSSNRKSGWTIVNLVRRSEQTEN
jgi:hypothetical protein